MPPHIDGGNIIDVFTRMCVFYSVIFIFFTPTIYGRLLFLFRVFCSSHFHCIFFLSSLLCDCRVIWMCGALWLFLYYLVWYFTCKYPVMRASNQPLHIIWCDDNFVCNCMCARLLPFFAYFHYNCTFFILNGYVILVFVTNSM